MAEDAARELSNLPLEDALQIVRLYAERGSPKYEKAAMRWLERIWLRARRSSSTSAEDQASLRKLEPAGPMTRQRESHSERGATRARAPRAQSIVSSSVIPTFGRNPSELGICSRGPELRGSYRRSSRRGDGDEGNIPAPALPATRRTRPEGAPPPRARSCRLRARARHRAPTRSRADAHAERGSRGWPRRAHSVVEPTLDDRRSASDRWAIASEVPAPARQVQGLLEQLPCLFAIASSERTSPLVAQRRSTSQRVAAAPRALSELVEQTRLLALAPR